MVAVSLFEKEESLVAEIVDLEEVGAEGFGVEDEVAETVPVVFDLCCGVILRCIPFP